MSEKKLVIQLFLAKIDLLIFPKTYEFFKISIFEFFFSFDKTIKSRNLHVFAKTLRATLKISFSNFRNTFLRCFTICEIKKFEFFRPLKQVPPENALK